jgi:endogenous inhibitor of DNA gyrase (YacG/DUF329 family)
MVKTLPCPTCGTAVTWAPESRWRPFCSERCRLIDLGDWLDEGHRISEPTDDIVRPEPDGEEGETRH